MLTCYKKTLFGHPLLFFCSLGGSAPQIPVIVGLRPPRLIDLYRTCLYNRGGRRPTISGGSGGRTPPVKKKCTLFYDAQTLLGGGITNWLQPVCDLTWCVANLQTNGCSQDLRSPSHELKTSPHPHQKNVFSFARITFFWV